MSKRWVMRRLPKGGGRFRTIYAPDKHFKAELRRMLPFLVALSLRLDIRRVLHGFMPFRGPTTNARAHVGFRFSLSFDLESYFDTVTADHLIKLPDPEVQIPQPVLDKCLIDGRVPQGFPTSPPLANIGGTWLDRALLGTMDRLGVRYSYTRYADDLVFSFDDYEVRHYLAEQVPRLAGLFGFSICRRKTSFQTSARGRRIVTGVAIGDHDFRATRRIRRRLRAALHQGNRASANGLAGWAEMKIPRRATVLWRIDKRLNKLMSRFQHNPTPRNQQAVQQLTQIRQVILLNGELHATDHYRRSFPEAPT